LSSATAPVAIKPSRSFLNSPWIYWPSGAAVLYGSIYLCAFLLNRYAAIPAHANTLRTIGLNLVDPQWSDVVQAGAVVLCVVLGFAFPGFARRPFQGAESIFARVANSRKEAVLLAGLLPIVIRLALLPVLPVPQPGIADEFGNLLIADTLASGRVTNPMHPMWTHFEETYVLYQPSYTSVYPIAPALFLALPKLFGATPWLGVVLSVGLMCALICWALQAWVPPRWALLGGLIAVANFAVISPWINNYWGGAVAAAGGALLLGAIGRILRREHLVRNSVLCGLALAIIAESRPYEGAFFAIPLFAGLALWIYRTRRADPSLRAIAVTLPLGGVLLATLAGMAYYNWRVTGDPLLLPPALQQKLYGMPQSFLWQPPILDAPRIHRYKEIADVFEWQLDAYKTGLTWQVVGDRLLRLWRFFLGPALTLPLLFLPPLMKRTWLSILFAAIALMLAANFLYPFFFPHYIAPAYPALILLIIEGLRYLRTIQFRHRPAGMLTSRLAVLVAFGAALAAATGAVMLPGAFVRARTPRNFVMSRLKKLGGSHLVLVQYNPGHTLHLPIIYNDANIDRSPVVWAHRTDPAGDRELIDYFSDRQVWYFNPDQIPLKLVPAVPKPYVTAVVNGAGLRDDVHQGVSPGGIAVILGGNLTNGTEGGSTSLFDGIPARLADASERCGDVFEPSPGNARRVEPAGPLPLRLNDISVQFNSAYAPILSASNFHGQDVVTVQVPFDTPLGTTPVTVRAGRQTALAQVLVLPVTPAIFEIRRPDSTRQAIILRPDGSLVDLQHPARHGESLRFLTTGLGPLNPAIGTNQRGPSSPSPIAYPLVVGIHHAGIPVLYARSAPGLIGVEEVGFKVPPEAPSGPAEPFAISVLVNGKMVFGNSSWIPVQ
jgi:uncharacterized protein (TIGR03437 family)